MQGGKFKPGSLSDRVWQAIQAGNGEPVPRAKLRAGLTTNEDRWLVRILDRLIVQGLARECCDGFIPANQSRALPPEHVVETVSALPDAMRPWIGAIVARAHAYRRAGAASLGADLLSRAAQRVSLPHVRADLLALSDLFFFHRETWGERPAERRAA
jgi:hypothetical protein